MLAGPVASVGCWTLLPADVVSQDFTAVALVEPDSPILVPAALALPNPAPCASRLAPRASALTLLTAAPTRTASKQAPPKR
jgi:hypothetical protein